VRRRRYRGENWKNPEGERVRAFALLITPANEPIGCVHDRMPALDATSSPKFPAYNWLRSIGWARTDAGSSAGGVQGGMGDVRAAGTGRL
jgi:hypothetical protein